MGAEQWLPRLTAGNELCDASLSLGRLPDSWLRFWLLVLLGVLLGGVLLSLGGVAAIREVDRADSALTVRLSSPLCGTVHGQWTVHLTWGRSTKQHKKSGNVAFFCSTKGHVCERRPVMACAGGRLLLVVSLPKADKTRSVTSCGGMINQRTDEGKHSHLISGS